MPHTTFTSLGVAALKVLGSLEFPAPPPLANVVVLNRHLRGPVGERCPRRSSPSRKVRAGGSKKKGGEGDEAVRGPPRPPPVRPPQGG